MNKNKLTMRQKEVLFSMGSMLWVLAYIVLLILIIRIGLLGIITEVMLQGILLLTSIAMTLTYMVVGRKKLLPQTFMFYIVICIILLVISYAIIKVAF